MIRVVFYRNSNGTWKGFSVKGHAGYAEAGKDIVCAAVSALVINTLNSLEAFTDDSVLTEMKDGLAAMKFTSVPGSSATLLMNSLEIGLQNIRKDHDRFIQIQYKEV
ncbi:MAG: ribosomal-processing cysteine protease Prp [Lachnospiraceae bacterium]|nr:ribosomal-processing cysteine protease Prp [Lachnospiraceae bacterium]